MSNSAGRRRPGTDVPSRWIGVSDKTTSMVIVSLYGITAVMVVVDLGIFVAAPARPYLWIAGLLMVAGWWAVALARLARSTHHG